MEDVKCSDPENCFCKGRRYNCPGCHRFVPECFGAADDMPKLCDDCWSKIHENIKIVSTKQYCSASIYNGVIKATAEASFVVSEWWVNRVVVEPPGRRGSGIGGVLLEKLKEAVRDIGGRSMLVTPGGYSDRYDDQVKFYRKHGFDDADCIEEGLLEVKL